LVVWGILEGLGPLRWRGNAQTQRQDRGSLTLLVCSYSFGMGCYFLLPLLLPSTNITWNVSLIFCTGVILVFVGIGVRWYAIWTLGKFFTTTVEISKDHQIVQHGPYRIIRHPSYTGILLSAIGMGLMMVNWASLCVLTIGLLVGLLYRMSIEEKVLCASLGRPYIVYMQQVKKQLIPFVF
jgi:protein-S-isoprenylcysteine O-methyltransferase Ste14